jgi:hydroxymethylpyrimidine/phosphomethylpyrimidine kinase
MTIAIKGRVLIVAASDSGGGAGIQADLKTVSALGAYGMTAITALTAQNTIGVFGVHVVPADFVAQQMRVVLDDIGADAIKIGMLANQDIVEAVAEILALPIAKGIPVVLDPVMLAKGGAELLDADGIIALKKLLIPRAFIFTPNLPEAEALTGINICNLDDMERAADLLLAAGARNVLLKGGHLPGSDLVDLLVGADGRQEFRHGRVETSHTHGTGCTLASAIAAGLTQGLSIAAAVANATRYIQAAIRAAPGFGKGNGPLGAVR